MSIAKYREIPVSKHSVPERRQYVIDVKNRDMNKFKKGARVLMNIRGKNVPAVMLKDLTPRETSIMIKFEDGREMRKDLATFYGFVGEKKQASTIEGEIDNLMKQVDKKSRKKQAAPKKGKKTIPQEIKKKELIQGQSFAAKAKKKELITGVPAPKVQVGKTYLKRNIKKGAGAAAMGKPKTTGKQFRTRMSSSGTPYKPPPY